MAQFGTYFKLTPMTPRLQQRPLVPSGGRDLFHHGCPSPAIFYGHNRCVAGMNISAAGRTHRFPSRRLLHSTTAVKWHTPIDPSDLEDKDVRALFVAVVDGEDSDYSVLSPLPLMN